jgi:hypothetical protein
MAFVVMQAIVEESTRDMLRRVAAARNRGRGPGERRTTAAGIAGTILDTAIQGGNYAYEADDVDQDEEEIDGAG